MLWQAVCSTGEQGEISCGFWKSQPTPYQDDLWLLLAWAAFESREKALETNPIYTLHNSGLVVSSPACIPLPLLRMSLTCGCIALFLFACRMHKTFLVGLDTTTPRGRAQWCCDCGTSWIGLGWAASLERRELMASAHPCSRGASHPASARLPSPRRRAQRAQLNPLMARRPRALRWPRAGGGGTGGSPGGRR